MICGGSDLCVMFCGCSSEVSWLSVMCSVLENVCLVWLCVVLLVVVSFVSDVDRCCVVVVFGLG